VFERLKTMRKAEDLLAMKDLQLFDRVYFDHQGEKIHGYVHRLNQKTVSVHDDEHTIWNVSPQLLHKSAEPTSDILQKLLTDYKGKK